MRGWSGLYYMREKNGPLPFNATLIAVGRGGVMKTITALSADIYRKGKILTRSRTETLNI